MGAVLRAGPNRQGDSVGAAVSDSAEAPPRDTLLKAEVAAFESAWNDRRWIDAAKARMAGLYERAVAALGAEGYNIRAVNTRTDEPVVITLDFETLELIAKVCRKAVREMGDDAPALVGVAAECMATLEALQAVLEGWDSESEDEGVRAAKLVILGSQMGTLHSILAQWETGIIEKSSENAWKLYRQGEAQRGRVASWEQTFLPHAVVHCEGKSQVTVAALVRLAKSWGEAEREAGRNPGLPGTDDGIERGIKRMEKRGVLTIPGRQPPPPPGPVSGMV